MDWIYKFMSDDISKSEPPDTIPNSEVKPFSADGSVVATMWE